MRIFSALGLSLAFSVSSFAASAFDNLPWMPQVQTFGRCKAGDVFCGGSCHSSADKCPDNDRPRDRDRDDNNGPCKAGDVYCGGECHSSWDRCPGNDRDRERERREEEERRQREEWERNRERDRERDGNCRPIVHCSDCNTGTYTRECRSIGCSGTNDAWTENCTP